ncbi:hypothetical protein V8C34DRAFT_268216 [Trichoderma compactum]
MFKLPPLYFIFLGPLFLMFLGLLFSGCFCCQVSPLFLMFLGPLFLGCLLCFWVSLVCLPNVDVLTLLASNPAVWPQA